MQQFNEKIVDNAGKISWPDSKEKLHFNAITVDVVKLTN